MYTIHSLIFLASVLLTAFCLTGIIAGIKDDSDKRYWKRRNESRMRAYAAVYKRRCMRENRDELWRRLSK